MDARAVVGVPQVTGFGGYYSPPKMRVTIFGTPLRPGNLAETRLRSCKPPTSAGVEACSASTAPRIEFEETPP